MRRHRLVGQTFVLTGTLPTLSRSQAQALIEPAIGHDSACAPLAGACQHQPDAMQRPCSRLRRLAGSRPPPAT